MRPAGDYELRPTYPAAVDDGLPDRLGWVTFAGVMLALGGVWNFVQGALAVAGSSVYASGHVYISSLGSWGWIVLILGILECLAALAVFTGNELAQPFGIGAASLNAIGHLMFVPIYPWWGIAMFAVDVLVIYALAAYGGARMRAR